MSLPAADPSGFRCPRCARVVATAWPSGDPVISLRVLRVFHAARPSSAPAVPPYGAHRRGAAD